MKYSTPLTRLLLLFLITASLHSCKKTIPDISNNPPPGSEIATPTPVGTATGSLTTLSIGGSGGTLISSDGKTELIFPAGALAAKTDISIQAITNNAPNGQGNAYRFLPEGLKFLQPVTVKFHYTAQDLASTQADLMGIAYQDSLGIWYRVNNFTSDAPNKIISAPIMHFSDWSRFDLMHISPDSATVRVNGSVGLTVEYVDAGSDEDLLAPIIKKTGNIKWMANGILNGNTSFGTISGSDNTAVYTAPAQRPSPNPVPVSAELSFKPKYHGKTFDNLKLVSNVTIVDDADEKYFLEVRITGTIPPLVYTDSVNMMVLVKSDGTVSFSNITNFAPKSTPVTATMGSCTATWVPDFIGEVNVTSVVGTINVSSGGSGRDLFLTFTNTGAISPTYTQQCDGADPETEGGIPLSGLPTIAFFTLVHGQKVYVVDSGDEYDKLTLIQ